MKRIFTLVLFVFGYLLALTVQAQQATNILFSHNGSPTSLTTSWTGTGGNKLVVFYANGGAFVPVNGTNYTADVNQNYTTATDKDSGAGEAKIVYSGTANSTTINGLSGNTFYTVKVFEFTGTNYTTSNSTNNPAIVWYHANSAATASYAVPAGVTSATVQVWGAGGGTGNSSGANRSASGGGGGAYASAVLTSLSGSYTITAPLGGAGTSSNAAGGNGPASSFGALLIANGGSGSTGDSGAAGGATGATGTIKFAGGAGGDRVTGGAGGGGGGGGSAGATGAGGTGSDASGANGGAAGAAGAGGGAAGGAGGTNAGATTGGNGNFPGGGGGGQGNGGTTSGSGAGGLVIVSYIPTDGTQPAAFTTGSVTSAGGTVTAGYWNSSNTSLQVVVPLTAADASLDGGSIQIQIENTTNTGYVSIPASGLSNITTVDRLAGTKTITISAANLVAATGAGSTGFLNGASHHLTAIVTDAFGNATTGAASATPALTVVDLTAPTVSSIVRKTPLSPYTQATSVTFTVTFAESVSGVDATDFTKTISGITAGAITVNAVSATVYDVDVAGISTTEGTLRLDVNASASITDNAGNSFGPVYNTGETYTFDYTNPAQPANYNAVTLSGNVVANYWNSHNTGVRLAIAVPNDNSLVGGNIVVEARISSGTFTTIATSGSSTIATANTTQNIDIDAAAIAAITGYAQGVSLQFQVKFVDFVGQSGTFRQSTNSLVVDTVKPSITGNPSYSDGGGGKESITISFSETIALTNNAVPVNTSTNGNPGFYSAQPQINNGGGTKYITGSNTIVLESNNNGEWTAPLNITYTSNVGVAGNYVRDAAGNEMTTVTISTNAPAPTLASSMVLDPNGAGNEIITFTTDIALNTPTTANGVTGITVDADGPGAGVAVTVLGTYNTTGNVITLNSSANNQWSSVTTVYYSAGNIASSSGTAMAAFGPEPILLGPVTIASNYLTNTAYAKEGHTVTLTFTANSTLSATPVVVIGGINATITGSHPNYTASITTTASNSEGVLTWSITAVQTSRSTEVKKTTNGSTVTFDKTDPTFTSLTIASNGSNTAYAKSGTNVIISFTVSETLGALPTATIDGKTATVVNTSGLNYTAAVTTNNTYNDGTLAFSVSAVDLAGNTGTRTTVTSGSGVTFDKTPPVVFSIVGSSTLKGIGNTRGIVPASPTFAVSFLVTFTETNGPLTGIDAADFTVSKDATVNYTAPLVVTGSGTTRTVTINGISGTGKISLGLTDDDTILDAASNPLGGTGTGNGNFAASFTGTQYYTIALPEPAHEVASLTATTVTSSSITVEWSQPAAGAQAATHYLVMVQPSSPLWTAPTDGVPVANSSTAQNIVKGAGTQSAVFNVSSGGSYDFIIYPYTLGANNADDNIDYNLNSPAEVDGIITNSASVSTLVLNSTPVPISSVSNSSGTSSSVMQFTINDDGLDPISPNVMTLQLNGLSQEKIVFNLRGQLTIGEGANVTGFTSSTGAIASAVYTGKGTTNTITLTNVTPGSWTASTTISYSSSGNAQFTTLGKMQPIDAHAVAVATDITQPFTSSGTFTVPAGVTGITVEAWGGGGAGGVNSDGNGGGGAGGGGAYSRSYLTVTPGASYAVTVGTGAPASSLDGFQGGSSSFGSLVVAAGGGGGGASDIGGNGGSGGNSAVGVGSVRFSGGNGGNGGVGTSVPGGGGGSSAGNAANGVAGTANTCSFCSSPGGVAPTGGGNGGTGLYTGSQGGFAPGGGGSGSGTSGLSGAGANGQIVVTYSDPTPIAGASDWDADNSPFKFSQLVITQGAGNTAALSNWQDVIATGGAELYDGVNPTPRIGTVNTNNITFSSIPSSSGTDVGYVADASGAASAKTYTLKVWVKNNLNSTLAASIDGMNLAFKLDPANITYDDGNNQKSSRLVASTPAIESGAEAIAVVATQLDFTTSPNTNQFVLTNITSTSISPDFSTVPVIRARDANGNLDKNYSASISLSGAVTTAPASVSMTNGVAVFPTTQYQAAGNGTLTASSSTLAANSIAPSSGVSATVTVGYSNLSTMATGTTSAISTASYYAIPYTFSIKDDNGSGGDGAPTRISKIKITKKASASPIPDWTDILDVANVNGFGPAFLYDGLTTSYLNPTVTVGTSDITFSNMLLTPQNANVAGLIGDNQTKTYQLYIFFKPSMTNGLKTTVDHMNFDFEILPGDIEFDPQSSILSTGQSAINSGPLDVDVAATNLSFATQPPADVLVRANLSTSPVVQALDRELPFNVGAINYPYGNLDLDYSASGSNITITNAGGLAMANLPTAFVSGVLTFPSNFNYTQTGNGRLTVASSGVATNGSAPTSTLSSAVTVRVGNAGTITAGALTEPATISSLIDLTHSPSGQAAFDFTINDDPAGTPANENDGNPTQLNSLSITAGAANTILNWTEAVASATLSDGTNTVTVNTINTTSLYFDLSSVTGQALGLVADGGSKTYTLKVWLKTTLGGTLPTTIDGKLFQFEVLKANVITSASSSTILAGQAQNSGTNTNKVDVNATKIDFITQPTTASVSVPMVPQIVVAARDANGNLDTDFVSAVVGTGNTPVDPGPFVTANDPTIGTLFSSGQLTYPSNFQFVVGDGDVRLTINAGSISGTSAIISSVTSYDSWLYFDPTFTYTTKVDFVNKQEDPITATSQPLGILILSDGGSATSPANIGNPNPGNKNQLLHADSDGSFTRINSFTISLTNFQNIRKIALYAADGVTKIGSDQNAAATVTFTGLGSSAYQAPDNGAYTFYIRASFNETVTDLDQITMQVTAVSHNSGSKFAEQMPVSPPATVGGVDGATSFGDSSPTSVNILDVIATSLDFTHQASPAYAGINEPIGTIAPSFTVPYVSAPLPSTDAAIVSARDKFANLDTEFNATPTITQTAGPNSSITAPRNFVSGILRLDGMRYTTSGDGTLKVVAGGIDSSLPASGNHIPGQLVNVVHVTTTAAVNGVLSTPNLKGGTPNAVIFGAKFTPTFTTTTEPSLKKFIFSFDNPYETSLVTILKNFRVTESLVESFAGSTDVTSSTIQATVLKGSSTNSSDMDVVVVDWGSNPPRPLFDPLTGNPISRTYFLVADVDITANISTPNLTPQLIDNGYISTTTDSRIVTTTGTATSNLIGQKYQFASTRPPVLKADISTPFSGQLNVDPSTDEIDLVFDVQVWSLDGVAELYNRKLNKKVANLNALNGKYINSSTLPVNPLKFKIDFLPGEAFELDEVYYVTIKKGTFDNGTNTGNGISDNGFNFYGGISSNAIFYFKISSPNPPNLTEAKGYFANLSTGSFSTKFDQQGTANYLVLQPSSAAPTADEIRNPATYGTLANIVASNSFSINKVNEFQTVTFSASLTNGTTYDVWIAAENDANPTHIKTTSPYGADFSIGSPGPTLKLKVPTPAPVQNNNLPIYSVCPDSYVTLTEPIVIGETLNGTFNMGSTLQTFYLLLPTGFLFDGINKPTVQLVGSDFDQSSLLVEFVNNTLISISYKNQTALNRDNIIITNLRVKGASGSLPGVIKRFAGNASIGTITDLASISISPLQAQKFTNSYTKDNSFTPFGFSAVDVITAIPDNYIDKDLTLSGGIRLTPTITPANDYGASFFTGNGVTNDVLSLSAVTPGAAFDITMTHTDPNGCVAQTSIQYVVYDHRNPISTKLGTQQPLINTNFPGASPSVVFPNTIPNSRINFNDLAGYNLIKLYATIPANAGTQIISGDDWKRQVAKIPVQVDQYTTSNIPTTFAETGFYRDYQWDYNHILNAVSESKSDNPSSTITKDPYDNFKVTPTGKAPYWTGGSLGKIEFVGSYQSTADFTVLVPFKQQVELFVPPIPVVEVDQSNQPVKGTAIYCEAGGGISITGYPQASAASSTGVFSLTTIAGTPLVIPSGAFIDNGNGTATLFPNLFNNSYGDIKINYTYKDNNSPVSGVGSATIKIAPNPISVINYTSFIGPNTPSGNVFCEKTEITFDASSSSITSGGVIEHYVWNFNDQTNSTGTNPNIDSAMVSKHTFIQPAGYTVSLTTTSKVGCVSAPKTSPLKVGSIPTVAFQFTGVSINEGITFKNTSTIPSASITGLGDGFAKVDWNYGDNTPINSVTTAPFVNTDIIHKYATAGLNHVNVKITSLLGCVNTRTSDIIVLSNEKPTPIASYLETFETSNGKWQPSSLPITSSSKNPASWLIGAPSNPVIKIDPAINEGKFVKTGAVSYNPSERSAFYSPVFDLSQLNRPMVSFNSFFQLETSDGVVLEYSIDPKNVADSTKEWFALGQPGEGVEWFTDRGIAAKPGNQIGNDYGWSQATITKWVESKHLLDVAAKVPRIVFRFALASVKSPAVDGFAFDNFRVGERTRTILMENFTTTNGKDAAQNSLIVVENDFINTKFQKDDTGTTIVKMNYHIGFTQPDPFNIDYPADPSARALYYNVKDVPYAMLDGARPDGATNLSTWGNAAYDAQTLQLGRAEIVVPTPAVNTDGSIKFDVKVTAKVDLPENTILHVAVIEQAILQSALSTEQKALIKTGESSFTYVLKQMLPNALGTRLGAKLLNGQTKTLEDFEYYPDPVRLYANADDLAIIVFLQNEDTKEVYQTAYVKGISDPPTVTGLEDGLRIEDVTLYPNPADQEINILMPRKAIGDVEIQLFDQMGKSVANSTIKTGEQKGTLNVRDLAASMYLMRLTENGVMTMKKVVVVHQN